MVLVPVLVLVLMVIGLGLIVPRFEALPEKPFAWIPKKDVGTERGGFVLAGEGTVTVSIDGVTIQIEVGGTRARTRCSRLTNQHPER